jgi:hypothetical protein
MDDQTGGAPQHQTDTDQPRRLDALAATAPEAAPEEDDPQYTCSTEPPPTNVKGRVNRPPPLAKKPAKPERLPSQPPDSANDDSAADDDPQYTCSTELPPSNVKG